jgi:hypothetical protein
MRMDIRNSPAMHQRVGDRNHDGIFAYWAIALCHPHMNGGLIGSSLQDWMIFFPHECHPVLKGRPPNSPRFIGGWVVAICLRLIMWTDIRNSPAMHQRVGDRNHDGIFAYWAIALCHPRMNGGLIGASLQDWMVFFLHECYPVLKGRPPNSPRFIGGWVVAICLRLIMWMDIRNLPAMHQRVGDRNHDGIFAYWAIALCHPRMNGGLIGSSLQDLASLLIRILKGR